MHVGRRLYPSFGFTLIELLVVIAVIGLLCGILFPVFATARGSSHKVVCQSNLKQLYAAFQLYASDWDNFWPCPGGLPGDYTYWSQRDGGGVDAYLRNQHMRTQSVFFCPSYPKEWGSPYSPRTYGMNSYLRTPPDIEWPASNIIFSGISPDAILYPERTILLYEGIQQDGTPMSGSESDGKGYVFRCGNWQSVRGYYQHMGPKPHYIDAEKPCHIDKNNYLMADGHIASMRPETYPDFRGPTSSANNLWYAQKKFPDD